MAAQKMGGCKKRLRKRRVREDITEARKETRQRRHTKHGHNDYAKRGSSPLYPDVIREEGATFDEEYKTYKKTKGRRGLNPSPDRRQAENPEYLSRNSVFNVKHVPITELMEKPIKFCGFSTLFLR